MVIIKCTYPPNCQINVLTGFNVYLRTIGHDDPSKDKPQSQRQSYKNKPIMYFYTQLKPAADYILTNTKAVDGHHQSYKFITSHWVKDAFE